jgi:hypothetical protein
MNICTLHMPPPVVKDLAKDLACPYPFRLSLSFILSFWIMPVLILS